MRTGRAVLLRRRGFTLMELLIVVAIIAVLVAVSIPVFMSQLEKAREATCLDNRRSLKSVLTVAYMEGGAENAAAAYTGHAPECVCPSGGTISYTVSDAGSVHVWCSKHDPGTGAGLTDKQKAQSALSAISGWFTENYTSTNTFIYSTGTDAAAFLKTLSADQQSFLADKYWFVKYYKKKDGSYVPRVFFTDKAAYDSAKNGAALTVYKYDSSTDQYQISFAGRKTDSKNNKEWFCDGTGNNWGAYVDGEYVLLQWGDDYLAP